MHPEIARSYNNERIADWRRAAEKAAKGKAARQGAAATGRHKSGRRPHFIGRPRLARES